MLRALKSSTALRNAVIFKHSDRFSAGIPDFSVTVNGNTLWVEVKMWPNTPTKLQEFYLKKLAASAVVVVAAKNGKLGYLSQDGCSTSAYNFTVLVAEIAKRCVG